MIDAARRAAYDVLHLVGADDAYANLALQDVLRERGLSGRDAAFATELAYGTLRWRGFHDAILARCVDRPLERLDPRVLDILRLGSHQLVILDTPPHAAVGETVALARSVAGEGPSKLVNAVLRKVSRSTRDQWMTLVAPDDSAPMAQRLAVVTSHPRWIVTALHEALGQADWSETRQLLDADNAPARVTLVARPGLISREELILESGGAPGAWSPLAVVLDSGNPDAVAAVRDGRAAVQDEGSQLVALALARAPLDGPDTTWIDLCAGPGGKAAVLAAVASQRGASLIAVEPRGHRARLVERSLRRIPGQHRIVEGDGTQVELPTADRILVDVPCTGLGVLRRRPEARWRRGPDDIARLASLQRELLTRALRTVRPGGLVAYSTCSPHRAETDLVVSDVLRSVDAHQLDAREAVSAVSLADMGDLGPGPAARLWPHRHGTDGMYLSLLRRP